MRLLLLLFVLLPSHASAQALYLDELLAKAAQLKLAERVEWHKLLHYLPQRSGVEGAVDSPHFYLAPDGKVNPQHELAATLLSFALDTPETPTQQSPQCAFIARYTWLNAQLHFDVNRLPPRPCARFAAWRDTLNANGLTLVFASAYLNSPSSMYGHTLLRVDGADQDERTRLLAYSISFAANTNESNGLAFAINGLFGGYPGTYSILPYYAKVREYSDFENRDIWEYQLNLSPDEVNRVLMHAWELGPHYYDYYFFDENCAYHLLGLLQVARPQLRLTEQFPRWAIPSDTVRAIANYPDLVKRTVYRPSTASRLRNRLAQMSENSRALVLAISDTQTSLAQADLAALGEPQAADVLESSLDFVNYRRAVGKSVISQPEQLVNELRLARSHLHIAPTFASAPPSILRPEQGHASARALFGLGTRSTQSFQELQIRPTYHDLMDSDAGYVHGAEINFFSLALRHYAGQNARVEHLIPVNIRSLAPGDEFFHSPSWQVLAGWQRVAGENRTEPLAFTLQGGAGGAWSTSQNDWLHYAFLNSSLRVSSGLKQGYALGIGPELGSYVDLNARWRIHVYAQLQRYLAGQLDTLPTLGIAQRVALSQDAALRFEASRWRELQRSLYAVQASYLLYF